ncbi:MAG TPA: DUF998 domain-containing protein [Pseudolysinimonas sp.]|nr:DUF998 domain-containing protein [Pseudolysinimonas sp.]
MSRASRAAAFGGILAVLAALVIIWAARLTIPRDLYVSELGAQGMPTAKWFQAALVLIVVGGTAIGWAGRGIRSRPRILNLWRPSATLFVSCGFFLVASQVTCTAGCPVPYGPRFTWPDFIHTTAAVIAFGAAVLTILQCAFAVGHRALRVFSLIAAISVAVIAGAGGLMSLLDFYPTFGSRLEFVATTIGLAWIAVFGVVLARPPATVPLGEAALPPQRSEELVG